MNNTLIAEATVTINAPAARVWESLTDPDLIRQYLFGADVITDWKVGSPILYKGTYMGPFEARRYASGLEQNLRGMQDSIEGPKAFAEKRKPAFTNS